MKIKVIWYKSGSGMLKFPDAIINKIMINKDKWIIGIDLDGTLLGNLGHSAYDREENNPGEVSPFNQKVIKHMIEIGHEVVITTGRNWGRTRDLYHQLGMKGFIVNNSGAHIHNKKDAWAPEFINGFPKYIFDELLEDDLIKEKILFYIVENTVTSYYKVFKHVDQIDINKNYRVMKEFDGKFEFNPQCAIISLDVNFEDGMKLVEYFREKYFGLINITNWGSTYGSVGLEISPANPNKGTALTQIAEILGIPKENTMGIGDGENDYDLLMWPQVGVAMKNGCDYIKEIANFETKLNNTESGVGHFLCEFFDLEIKED